MQAELVLDARNATGESPVWHAAEQALYWVDIPARQLHRLVPATGAHSTWAGDEMLACIAPRAGHPGQWIAGMESGLFAIATKDDGTLAATSVARATHAAHGMRFNDGRCDRQGRFWAGTMLMDMAAARAVGRVYRYQSDVNEEAALRVHFDEMIVPNGMAFSPDGRLDRSLEVPVKKPAMCAFGGAQLDTLYVTSIRPGGDVSDQPLAGGVFALRPGVQGVPEPACIF